MLVIRGSFMVVVIGLSYCQFQIYNFQFTFFNDVF
jgi:hypothetical protein